MITHFHVLNYLFACLFLVSCSTRLDDQPDQLPELFSEPIKAELKLDGYLANQLTGTDADLVYDANRVDVISGKPIPAIGIQIDPSRTQPPRVRTVGVPSLLKDKNSTNVSFSSPEEIELDSIVRKGSVSIEHSTPFIISAPTDTILTGIQLPTSEKEIKFSWPKPVKAFSSLVEYGNGYKIDTYNTEQGFPSSNIDQLIVGKNNILWFLCDHRLMSYDGEYYKIYGSENGFAGYDMRCLHMDSNGVLWIGTNGSGLLRFDGKTFKRYQLGSKISSVSSIVEGQDGLLWIGTNYLGLVRFDGKSRTHFTVNEGLESNTVKPFMIDDDRTLWLAVSRSLCTFKDETIMQYHHPLLSSINDVFQDSTGLIWIATENNGVIQKTDARYFHLERIRPGRHHAIEQIDQDLKGGIWLGTRNGVFKYQNETFIQVSESDELFVQDIFVGTEGEIWISTAADGVHCYRPNPFEYPIENTSRSDASIIRVFEDSKGNVWYGTDGDGVILYDGETYKVFNERNGFPRIVRSILEDSKGNMWFGSQGQGAFYYDGTSIRQYTKNSGLIHTTVFKMVEDNRKRIWFGTNGGLCVLENAVFTHYGLNEGLSDLFILDIIEDHNNHLWYATWKGGVTKYDGESFIHYTEREGLSNNEVWSIAQDDDNNYWFATANGLNKFDGTSFTYYTKKQGLSDNRITNVIADALGNLWVASTKGLDLLNIDNSETKYEYIIPFKENDGLISERIDAKGLFIDSKNHLQIGTSLNLTELDLNTLERPGRLPEVILHSLVINEMEYDYRKSMNESSRFTYSSVPEFYNYPEELELSHDHNHLIFYFSGIDWSAQDDVNYSYRIREINPAWSKPSREAKADYRNLPYGDFNLEIMAIGKSGEWSNPFIYPFTIHPPWWLTPWAYLLYGIAAILTIISLVLWRTIELRKRQKVLELQIKNATEEIREQKNEIEHERDRSEELLLNILPEAIAEELKEKGAADAKHMESVTVIFTDFKGFTALSENLSPEKLVKEINLCFSSFDHIMEKHNIEKIKTIGDAYMAAGGLPTSNDSHPLDVVKAALEIQEFMSSLKETKMAQNEPYFEVRIGVHTGPVVAGIVGVRKFQYDIWGDTVNTASRMESTGEVGRVNISESTYQLVKDQDQYTFQSRGMVDVKGKGMLEMFFIERKS